MQVWLAELGEAVGFVLKVLGIFFLVFPFVPSLRDMPVAQRLLIAIGLVVVYVAADLVTGGALET